MSLIGPSRPSTAHQGMSASELGDEVFGPGGPPPRLAGHALLAGIRLRPKPRSVSAPWVTIVAAYCVCRVRASVRSRLEMARSMMGSGEARSSKLTARAGTHRDRNGLTFPTSSAEQIATPERSLCRPRRRRLAEAEVCIRHPHTGHDDSQLSGYCHACLLRSYAFGELHAPCSQDRPFLRDPKMRICRLV